MDRIRQMRVDAFLGALDVRLRKTQATNLCLVVLGLVCCRRPSLSAVARHIQGPLRLIHRIH
jgi:hypothetical protein